MNATTAATKPIDPIEQARKEGFEAALKLASAAARKDAAHWDNLQQDDMPGFCAPKLRDLADTIDTITYQEV